MTDVTIQGLIIAKQTGSGSTDESDRRDVKQDGSYPVDDHPLAFHTVLNGIAGYPTEVRLEDSHGQLLPSLGSSNPNWGRVSGNGTELVIWSRDPLPPGTYHIGVYDLDYDMTKHTLIGTRRFTLDPNATGDGAGGQFSAPGAIYATPGQGNTPGPSPGLGGGPAEAPGTSAPGAANPGLIGLGILPLPRADTGWASKAWARITGKK